MLGDACPPGLAPGRPEADVVDLVVVAGGELAPAIRTAAERLAPDGILYVAARPWRAARAIRAAGLEPARALVPEHQRRLRNSVRVQELERRAAPFGSGRAQRAGR